MDYVLIDGDQAIFDAAFEDATVVVQPGKLVASGPATVGDTKMCIAGDEASVSVPGCAYTTKIYSVPGTGTLEIAALGGDQTATKTQSGGTKVLLVGSTFTARFKVVVKAQPPPNSGPPDGKPEYSGSGHFETTNTKFRGS